MDVLDWFVHTPVFHPNFWHALVGSSRFTNGNISGNVAAGSVYSGLQSMAAGGAGGAAAAKTVGGALGAGLYMAARGRGEDGENVKGGEDECRKKMDE